MEADITDAKRFFELIDQYNNGDDADRVHIETVILEHFRQHKAVLALDIVISLFACNTTFVPAVIAFEIVEALM